MKEAVSDLIRSLKITAGSRFSAAKRLTDQDKLLTALTALTTSYVIIITIFPYFVQIPKNIADTLNLITVFFSIIVLISSLLQYSSNNNVRAEQFHRSALEINELRRELKSNESSIKIEEFNRVSHNYNNILQKYSINHDDIDFIRYQIDRPNEFPHLGLTAIVLMRSQYFLKTSFPLTMIIITTAIFAYLVFWYALPQRI